MTTYIRNHTAIHEAEDITIGDFVPGDALVFNESMDGLIPLSAPASLEGLTTGQVPYYDGFALADSGISTNTSSNPSFNFSGIAAGSSIAIMGDASSGRACAVGQNSVADYESVAFGYAANAAGSKSVAIGAKSQAAYSASGAIGNSAAAVKANQYMLGNPVVGEVATHADFVLYARDSGLTSRQVSAMSATMPDPTAASRTGKLALSVSDWAAERDVFTADADGTKSTAIVNDQVKITEFGGVAVRMTNKTGAASVKGTVLAVNGAVDRAVETAAAGAYDCVAVMYSDGVADGSECWVVVSGLAQVLLEDGTNSIRDGWVKVGTVAGRADASGAVPSPPTDSEHFKEIGHCVEAQTAGTEVLALVVLHFN